MTDARVEKVYADKVRAEEFLAQAAIYITDATSNPLDPVSKAVLFHNASIAACDAILQSVGLRVTSGDHSHSLRIETALQQVGSETEELLDRLDASRARRNEASYAAAFVSQASLVDAREATEELIELARVFVQNR
jgi:hypothetical protein